MITADERKKLVAYDEHLQEAMDNLIETDLADVSAESYKEFRQEQADEGKVFSKSFYTNTKQEKEAEELQKDYGKILVED